MVHLVLLVFAFVLAVVAALVSPLALPGWPRVHWGWLALACYLAALLFGGGAAIIH